MTWVSAGNDGLFTLTPGSSPGQDLALSRRGRGGFNCVLCFSLDSRLRRNDGLFTLTLGPPLNLPLGGGGRWLESPGSGFPPVRE